MLISSLLNIELPRKRFECLATNDRLFAMNTSKNTFIALIFTLFSCGLLFSGFVEAIVNKQKLTIEFILVFFIIHFIIGLAGLRQFLWLINGRHELLIENGKLTLTKKGTFLTNSKTYSLDLVTNIRQAIDEDKLSSYDKTISNISLTRKVLFRQTLGEILFDYNGKTIGIFSDLNKNEKADLTEALLQRKKTSH